MSTGVSRRNLHSKRSIKRLSLLTLIIFGLSACSAGPFAPANDVTAIKEDLLKLQGTNGLIKMPEAGDQERGDIYTTALYSDDLGSYLLAADEASKAVDEDVSGQDTTDLLTLWSALKLLKATGGTLSPALEAKLANAAIPIKQPDVGAEIAALWFWIDVGRMHDWSGTARRPAVEEVNSRLEAVDVSFITNKPYLLWRLFDSYSALQKQKPVELQIALNDVDVKRLPADYESTLDFQAALETRVTLKNDLVVPNDAKDHIVKLLDSGQVDDDALIDSMLRSLKLLDSHADAQRLVKDRIATRIAEQTGLVRSSAVTKGSVHGTYLAARLLDANFPEIAKERTQEELTRVLATPDTDVLTQLKALVALKRSGSESWLDYGTIIEQGEAKIPTTVTSANLSEYIELVDVLVQVDSNVQLGRLAPFEADPKTESSLSSALLALSNSHFFTNSEEVRSMFPAVQAQLPELILEPNGKGLNYFRALTAMTSAGLSGLDSNDFEKAAQGLQKLKGCEEFPSLYRLEEDKASACSLSLSAAMIAVPGAYNLGESK
jgi:hypothetical protein